MDTRDPREFPSPHATPPCPLFQGPLGTQRVPITHTTYPSTPGTPALLPGTPGTRTGSLHHTHPFPASSPLDPQGSQRVPITPLNSSLSSPPGTQGPPRVTKTPHNSSLPFFQVAKDPIEFPSPRPTLPCPLPRVPMDSNGFPSPHITLPCLLPQGPQGPQRVHITTPNPSLPSYPGNQGTTNGFPFTTHNPSLLSPPRGPMHPRELQPLPALSPKFSWDPREFPA